MPFANLLAAVCEEAASRAGGIFKSERMTFPRAILNNRPQAVPEIRDGLVTTEKFDRDGRGDRLNKIFGQSCVRTAQIIEESESRFDPRRSV
jgi:hypothetical protein